MFVEGRGCVHIILNSFVWDLEIEEKGLVKVKNVDVIAPHECGISPEALLPTSIDTSAISAARKEHPMYATR
jgi:hypothetical protein